MKKYKVLLKLESPLIVGGYRQKDNVAVSLDYIPGSVLRAAFVRKLLLGCPLYGPEDVRDGRYNYIYIRDEEYCSSCGNCSLCRGFSNIRLSFFYPQGVEIIPLTASRCKENREHGFKDSLADRLTGGLSPEDGCGYLYEEKQASSGGMRCSGRMEAARGYRTCGSAVDLSRKRVYSTKIAVDPYTRRAKDGFLYSLNAIQEGEVFEGAIAMPDGIPMFEEGTVVYMGRRSSSGFGKISVTKVMEEDGARRDIGKDIIRFGRRLRESADCTRVSDKRVYIPVLLKSDAKLGIEGLPDLNRPKSDRQYLEMLERLILGERYGVVFRLEEIVAEHGLYKGYDTSKRPGGDPRAPTYIMTMKGTSFILSAERDTGDVMPYLHELEESGIGLDTANGYGQIEICNDLHVEGEIYNDERNAYQACKGDSDAAKHGICFQQARQDAVSDAGGAFAESLL